MSTKQIRTTKEWDDGERIIATTDDVWVPVEDLIRKLGRPAKKKAGAR